MSHGICRIPMAPLRAEPSHRSELVTQLLFGEAYELLETAKEGQWLHVRSQHDGYEAYLSADQHFAISDAFVEEMGRTEYRVSLPLWGEAMLNRQPILLPQGSILPVAAGELFAAATTLSFPGESKPLGDRRDGEFLAEQARRWLNAPYLWGGRTPAGVDCSGFVQVLFRLAGVKLPRDAYQQATVGKSVALSTAQVGDLAYFVENDRVTHVGMVHSEGRIIHASGKVRIDLLTSGGIVQEATNKQTHTLSHLRRVLAS